MNGYLPALAGEHRVTTEGVKVETKYYLEAFCFTRTMGRQRERIILQSKRDILLSLKYPSDQSIAEYNGI
jgi:hypothetical protein